MVKRTQDETEEMLFRIDKMMKNVELPHKMYDEAVQYMGTYARFSIDESFARNYFYRELTPQLQNKLISAVLGETIEMYRYFFNDYEN